MTPQLLATLRDQNPTLPIATACRITRVDYAGDEGGIACYLIAGRYERRSRLITANQPFGERG